MSLAPPPPPSPAPKVILITDPRWSVDHTLRVVDRAAAALGPGALMVQLRDKEGLRPLVALAATRLRRATRDAGALFAINTIRKQAGAMIDIAEEVGADALHVACGLHTVAAARSVIKWVSVPTHSDAESLAAHTSFADAMLVSPIFMSPGKGLPRGLGALGVAQRFRCRVYALGGITPDRAQMCADAGAHGVAVIRSLLGAEDPAAAALELAKPFLAPAEEV